MPPPNMCGKISIRIGRQTTLRLKETTKAFIVYTGLKMEKKYRENRTIRKQQTSPTVKNTEEQY